MNEYEWIAWQAVSDLIRMVMITGWLWFGWVVWRTIRPESKRRGK